MALLRLHEKISQPVLIDSIEILCWRERYFVRTTSADGAVGIASANHRLSYLSELIKQRIVPSFLGRDARELEALLDGVYLDHSNYKLAGVAFWNGVGHVEISLLDMLGKIAGLPVGALLGEVRRREIPVYLSSLRRDTTPQQEVEWLSQRLLETGANAVKIKVGGRMSSNADAMPGRSEQLISLARKTWGDDVTIYADANGSYDAAKAIEVGRMLQDHGVSLFEEPCPFDEYEDTKKVADALDMTVAGGEQDTSMARWKWMIENRGVDLVQPDLCYNGGFVRCLRVAQMAARAGMKVTPHSPKADANAAPMLHFTSVVPNLGPHQEFRGEYSPHEGWHEPALEIKNGCVAAPDGPGLGVSFSDEVLREAVVV